MTREQKDRKNELKRLRYAANPEKYKQIKKNWLKNNPDQVLSCKQRRLNRTPEQIALYNKNRNEKRRANKEQKNKEAREYYHKNIERCRANGRRSYEKNGEKYYQKYTKEKREEFRKKSDEYKLALGCIDCGYKENAYALEFDHVNGKKTRCVSQYNNWDLALAEVKKCVVRCANCHRIKTFTNREHLNRMKR